MENHDNIAECFWGMGGVEQGNRSTCVRSVRHQEEHCKKLNLQNYFLYRIMVVKHSHCLELGAFIVQQGLTRFAHLLASGQMQSKNFLQEKMQNTINFSSKKWP